MFLEYPAKGAPSLYLSRGCRVYIGKGAEDIPVIGLKSSTYGSAILFSVVGTTSEDCPEDGGSSLSVRRV